MSVDVRRVAAGALVVAGVYGWLGWPAACLAAAALLYATRLPVPDVARWVARGRSAVAAVGRWPVVQRASATLTAAGIVALALGLALALGPGWGITAAGVALGAIGLKLESRDDPPTP